MQYIDVGKGKIRLVGKCRKGIVISAWLCCLCSKDSIKPCDYNFKSKVIKLKGVK